MADRKRIRKGTKMGTGMEKTKSKIEESLMKLDNYYQNINRHKLAVIFLSTFVWGIAAHGFMFFNKFSWGDDVANMYFFGTTEELGRWMLEILRRFFIFLFETNCSQPFINGMGSMFCIGCAIYLLTDLIPLEKDSSLIAVSGAFVTVPTMLSMFTYMFTAFAYMIGMLMSVAGVWIVCKGKPHLIRFITGALFICAAIGVYQAWLPMALSVFLLYFLTETLKNDTVTFKKYWIKAFYYLGVCAAALVLYLIINEYVLMSKGLVMNDHANVNTYGMVSVQEYINRIWYAYRIFFRPSRGFYPSFISKVYKLMLLWAVILTVYQLVKGFRRSMAKGLQSILLLILFPLAVCFINVLSGDAFVLVLYPYTLVYLYFIWLLEREGCGKNKSDTVWRHRFGILLVLCMCLWLVRYSNVSYLKANIVQQRAIAYYTTLITRMQSTEGYSEDMPVAYVNDSQNKSLAVVTITEDLYPEPVIPHTFLNDYSWKLFIKEWCGFSPKEADAAKREELEALEEVRNMPAYPNDGSIKIIDGILVVKMTE